MVISVDVTGISKSLLFLKKTSIKETALIEAAIVKSAFFIEAEVKLSIAGRKLLPRTVDTGRFLNSVKTILPKKFEAKIESNVEYAKNLEFGTSKMQARPHFRNTAKINDSKVKNFVRTAVITASK